MKIYALLYNDTEGNKTFCISEDILKIDTKIEEYFGNDYSKLILEIWENGEVDDFHMYFADGIHDFIDKEKGKL